MPPTRLVPGHETSPRCPGVQATRKLQCVLTVLTTFDLPKVQICRNPNTDASRDFASGHCQEELDKQPHSTIEYCSMQDSTSQFDTHDSDDRAQYLKSTLGFRSSPSLARAQPVGPNFAHCGWHQKDDDYSTGRPAAGRGRPASLQSAPDITRSSPGAGSRNLTRKAPPVDAQRRGIMDSMN